jgi:hypothetical protein
MGSGLRPDKVLRRYNEEKRVILDVGGDILDEDVSVWVGMWVFVLEMC